MTEVLREAWLNDDPATLVIDDAMNVSALGRCNRFRGQVQPSGLGLAFPENMAGTIVACPDEIEAQEQRFLDALAQVSDCVRYGADLVMEDFDGRASCVFSGPPNDRVAVWKHRVSRPPAP